MPKAAPSKTKQKKNKVASPTSSARSSRSSTSRASYSTAMEDGGEITGSQECSLLRRQLVKVTGSLQMPQTTAFFSQALILSSCTFSLMATSCGLVLACVAVMIAMAGATQFRVGGSKGWSVPDPDAMSYNQWAQRNRFLFVYPPDKDSVLQVGKEAYDACNTKAYVEKYDDGNTVVTFNRSGPFYFISGVEDNCLRNESVVVVVMADRSNPSPSPSTPVASEPNPSPSPSTASAPSPPPPPSSPPSPAEVTPAPGPAPWGEEPNPPSPPNMASLTTVGFMGMVGSLLGSVLFALFAISTFTVRYERYIPVRQVAGTQTARYRAVPPKIDRWRSIKREKGKKKKKKKRKKRKKEKRRRKNNLAPVRGPRPCTVTARAPSPLARRRRPRVAGAFSPARGEISR
ncbi:hypothetical protein BHM03_00052117 [Ensete ventricosum]|nr:hypothetical protein BHM03_00052117 [Ensete ventricosum]